jgi:hypothetical protein
LVFKASAPLVDVAPNALDSDYPQYRPPVGRTVPNDGIMIIALAEWQRRDHESNLIFCQCKILAVKPAALRALSHIVGSCFIGEIGCWNKSAWKKNTVPIQR